MHVASGACLLLPPPQSVAEIVPVGAEDRGSGGLGLEVQLGRLGLQGLKLSFRRCHVLRLVGP